MVFVHGLFFLPVLLLPAAPLLLPVSTSITDRSRYNIQGVHICEFKLSLFCCSHTTINNVLKQTQYTVHTGGRRIARPYVAIGSLPGRVDLLISSNWHCVSGRSVRVWAQLLRRVYRSTMDNSEGGTIRVIFSNSVSLFEKS